MIMRLLAVRSRVASTQFSATHLAPVEHVLFIATVLIWAAMEVRQGRKSRVGATHADRGSRMLLRLSYVVGLVVGLLLARVLPGGEIGSAGVTSWLGLSVLWCGVGLRLWCFHTLGQYFTFTVQTSADQTLVTAGPYRLIRHPSYAASLVGYLGVGLVIGNWWFMLGSLSGLTVGVLNRIRVEEQALAAELGPAYEAYAATRKRLIPFIW
jgi:protein-S-isoprenylcysteine O-methyltransferase Ste14